MSDESDKGVSGAFKHGHALDIHKRDDTLSCKQAMSTTNESTITDLVQFFVPASDGSTYCFGATGSIYARSGDGAWNFAYNDENGAIKGAAEWELSDGNNYLFWATSTAIARTLINGSLDVPWAAGVATQVWKTENVQAVDWHTMKPAGGSLLIANGEALAEVEYDGDWNPRKMNVRPGNWIKTLEERNDYVIMGSEREDDSEEGHLWSWISTAVNWVEKKKIPIKGVNALIYTELPLLQGGADGEIFLSDFQTPTPLNFLSGGGQVNPGGVAIENDLAVFGFYGGTYPGIWSYGRKNKNRPFSLNYEYRLAKTVGGSSVSTIGAVAVVDGTLLASWGTTDGSTSDYGVDEVSSTTKATALYEGLEFDGGRPYLKKWLTSVKLNMVPLPSGTSVSVKFKGDKETDWRYAVLGNGSTTYSTANSVETEFLIGKPAMVYEIGVELNPSVNSTPEILAITGYLDSNYEHG